MYILLVDRLLVVLVVDHMLQDIEIQPHHDHLNIYFLSKKNEYTKNKNSIKHSNL